MGVELKVFLATGVCLNIQESEKDEKLWTFIKKLMDDEDKFYHIEFQDNYGNLDGEARFIIYETSKVLMDKKVGFTPFNFIHNQIYNPSHDTLVYGGARKYFAIETSWKEQDERLVESKELLDKLGVPDEIRASMAKGYNEWIFSYYY